MFSISVHTRGLVPELMTSGASERASKTGIRKEIGFS